MQRKQHKISTGWCVLSSALEKFQNSLFIILSLMMIFFSSHSSLSKFFDYTFIYPIIGLLFSSLILINARKIFLIREFSVLSFILIFLILLYFLADVLILEYKKSIGWAAVISYIVILNNQSTETILKFLKVYINIIALISGISIFLYIYFIFFGKGNFENFFLIKNSLIHYDSMVNTLLGKLPRITAHLNQASLIPAYFIFPFAIYQSFTKKILYVPLIIISSYMLLTFGSSVYLLIISGLLLSILFPFLKKTITPLFLMNFLFFSLLAVLVGLVFLDSGGQGSIQNNLFFRVGSGVARLMILYSQIDIFFHNFLTGYNSIDMNRDIFLLGSVLWGSGVRVGIFGFLIAAIFFLALSKRVVNIPHTLSRNKISISFTIACIFMTTGFQDFGFSSFSGFTFFGILSILLDRIITHKPSDNLDSKNRIMRSNNLNLNQ